MRRAAPVDERFRDNLRALGLHGTGARVLVALSGGVDSVVLLHLLRFHAAEAGIDVSAAHFDHDMRPGSDGDARWVAGLCRAWNVPLVTGCAERRLTTEDGARRARYAFLREALGETGATHLATAHHADDQAETVLFRVLRGSGLAGLAGIAASDDAGLVRPLLPFWRGELARWARAHALRWRDDPTNRHLGPARNRLRRQVLPLLERTVAPGARRSLVRLAALAREDAAAWEALLARAEGEAVRREDGAVVLVRKVLAGYDSPLAARLLRRVLRPLGCLPDRAGTRRALQFITTAPSGRELRLPGGVRIRTEFDAARVDLAGDATPSDMPLLIPAPAAGSGRACLGGHGIDVGWRPATGGDDAPASGVVLATEGLRFPLTLRGRAPGDRIRLHAGTRPLKKVLGEARVPRSARDRLPVLADAHGAVLWVAGVAQAAPTLTRGGEPALRIDIHTDGEWLTLRRPSRGPADAR